MHPKFQRADELSRLAIGAAIEVHRLKGPGLIESIYEKCIMRELFLQSIQAAQQIHHVMEHNIAASFILLPKAILESTWL